MKRYLVFMFPPYEAGGGWSDFVADYDTLEEARANTPKKRTRTTCWQIVDCETKEIIES